MRRAAAAATVVFVFLASMSFVASFDFPKAHGLEMSYSQTISQDTTWTKAESPITLPGNVLVSKGTTLTIMPGVIIYCNKNVIQVNGTLKVLGSNDDKVVFHTNNRIVNDIHEQSADISFGDDSSDCVIENAILETMGFTYYHCRNSIIVNNNYFKDSTATTNSGHVRVLPTVRGPGNAIITNNVFTSRIQLACSASVINNTFNGGGIDASDGSFLIINNTMIGYPSSPFRDGYGISTGNNNVQKAVISDNRFSNYVEACITVDGPALIQRNFIQNTPTNDQFKDYPFFGIHIDGSSPLIANNTITNAGIGIDIHDQGFVLTRPIIEYNNINNNVKFSLYLGYPARSGYNSPDYTVRSDIPASNNYWGPNDQGINQTIYDSKYQSSLGTANIAPFLTSPNPNAMPNPDASSPTLEQVPPAEYYQATSDNNQNIVLTKIGNLTIYPNDRINVTTNLPSASTNVTFLTRGDLGNFDFVNLTIPRSAISYGTTPKVFFGNLSAEDQGYTHDASNYYVWCTTNFNSYFFGASTIVFASSSPNVIHFVIIVTAIVAVAAAGLLLYNRKRRKEAQQK